MASNGGVEETPAENVADAVLVPENTKQEDSKDNHSEEDDISTNLSTDCDSLDGDHKELKSNVARDEDSEDSGI